MLLLPVMAVLTVVILVPEVWSLYLSLTNYSFGVPLHFIGIKNYVELFRESGFLLAVVRNFLFVFLVVVLQVAYGVALALLLARGFPLQKLWLSLLIVPIAISPSVMAVIWKYLLNFNFGPIDWIVQQFGFARVRWLSEPRLAFLTVCLVYVWASTPHVLVIVYPARLTFPQPLYETAAVEGASAWQTFRNVTWPLLQPVLSVVIIFRIMIAFRTFGIIWTMTQGGPDRSTETVAIYLYNEGFRYWKFGAASAVALVMLVLTLIIAGGQMRTMYRNLFEDAA